MYLYILTCIYYTCDVIPPPPPTHTQAHINNFVIYGIHDDFSEVFCESLAYY